MGLRSHIAREIEIGGGAYHPNHFLLLLDPGTPFIVEKPDGSYAQNNTYLDVFVHEYWHYLHNVTTLSGFKAFAFTQNLLSSFSHTLMKRADGRSSGSGSLTSEHRAAVQGLLALQALHDGEPGPSGMSEDFDARFRVTGIQKIEADQPWRNGIAPNPAASITVEVSWPNGGQSTIANFLLGSLAIEESVAFLIERRMAKALGKDDAASIPEFPYRVLERIVEFSLNATSVSDYVPAALGTLALLTTHPGAGFIECLQLYKKARAVAPSDAVAIDAVRRAVMPRIAGAIETVLKNDLAETERIHTGRGLLQGAVAHVSNTFRRSLQHRLDEPFFDLRPFFPTPDINAFHRLMAEFPSCDLLQERSGEEDQVGRDLLICFASDEPDEHGHRPTDYLRSFQAQQEYLFSHLDKQTMEFVPSEAAARRCPFYGECDLPLRLNNPDVCYTEPWIAYREPQWCWYGTAVAATLGTVKI